MVRMFIDTSSVESYKQFLAIKKLPTWSIRGRVAEFPDEYAEQIGMHVEESRFCNWDPSPFLFDYQSDISKMAIQKRKFAVFADCGLGKTLIMLEYAQAAIQQLSQLGKGFLIVSPLMVVSQTMEEAQKWYPGLDIDVVRASGLQSWLDNCGGRIGITNYEALRNDVRRGSLGGLALDESSILKSHYGKYGSRLLDLGKGCDWKLCLTGTPAPNDRIEYANHAVFLDHYPTVNAFLATYFVNRGQTSERWVLKDHALRPFYRSLSHWSIFLSRPSVFGWKDNTEAIPEIKVNIHRVELSEEQKRIFRMETGDLFATNGGGITKRSIMGQIAKGNYKGKAIETLKPGYIRDLCEGFNGESSLVWCRYNKEQATMHKALASLESESISGDTPHEQREEFIKAFKAGQIKHLITKPKILGFGLNLQVATRQVFSTLQDSYEEYYQAIKRSNRIGSTQPLNVHIPITELEEPMAQNVLAKASQIQNDTEEQERIFSETRTR